MIYSNMNTTSTNMRLSQSELSRMIREQQEELYSAENDKEIRDQAEADRIKEAYFYGVQNMYSEQMAAANNRTAFLQNVKEAFLTDCIMKLFSESTQCPMTKNDKIIARNLVTRFIKENNAGDLLRSFESKNLLLSEMSRITQKYYDRVLNESLDSTNTAGLLSPDKDSTRPAGTKPWEVREWDLPKSITDDFYGELINLDTMDASKLIKDRVADSIQQFIDSNAIAKMEYEDIINQAQEKIASAKNEAVVEEYANMAKHKINEMKLTRPKSIFNVMVESLTRKALTDDSYKTRYVNESKVDMDSIVDDTTLLYTMLEMVNTTNMIAVDESFISNYLESLK